MELERETSRAQPVFPIVTPLNETVAELGGYGKGTAISLAKTRFSAIIHYTIQIQRLLHREIEVI